MNALKIIIGILDVVILATGGGIVIFHLWKATRKPSLCDTCKWLTSKNTSEYYTYTCYPNGNILLSQRNHEPPEYCKSYCKREGCENGAE